MWRQGLRAFTAVGWQELEARGDPESPINQSSPGGASPGGAYDEASEAIGQECERLLAVHEQLRNYLEAPPHGT